MPGRGGAGNYEAAAAAKKDALQDHDLQAQLLEHSSDKTNTPAGYAATGRGGAGNFYSSQQDGGHQDQVDTPAVEPTSPRDKAMVNNNVYRGRGGAGNLESAAAENRQHDHTRAADVAQLQEKIQSDVAKDVEHILPRPPRARLPYESP